MGLMHSVLSPQLQVLACLSVCPFTSAPPSSQVDSFGLSSTGAAGTSEGPAWHSHLHHSFRSDSSFAVFATFDKPRV